MASIKFLTRSKDSKLVPVYLRFIDGRETDFWLPTPFRLFPEYWNNKAQTFKPRILYSEVFTETDKQDLQRKFQELKDFVMRELFTLSAPITKNWLQATVDKFYYKDVPSNENLTEYINRFVDDAKSGKRLANAGNTKKRYAYGSLRVLTGFKLSWEMFCTAKKKQYNFDDVNIDLYNDFVKFFYDRKCGANYIGKHIKTLKTIMRQAREDGLHNNQEIERKAFKTISEEVEHIYLTADELKKLFELNISKFDLTPKNTGLKPSEIKFLPVVRDIFLAGCYTAQRYSDYSRISKDNIKMINGKKVVSLIQKKTGETCLIPVRPELETILKRYDYTLPKSFEQKVNTGIKLIGKLAGITDPIHVEKFRGGVKVKTDVPKHSLICTHTARRTGCSLMYLAGIPIIDIMKLSGHRTPQEFLKYVRISKEETVINMGNHPYFTGTVLKVV